LSKGAARLPWLETFAETLSKCARALSTAAFFGALAWGVCAGSASAQTQSQIQYTYDAAGNLIQVTRSAVTPKADLTVTNLSVGSISKNGDGSFNVPATFRINNIGNSAAVATWYDRGYLSANSTLHDTDQALGGFNTRTLNLAIGANYTVSTTFTTTTTTTPGDYTLIVKADGGASLSGQYSPTGANYVAESDETNNTQSAAINLPANALPDLTVSNASVGTIVENQDASYSIPVTFTVNNVGNNVAQPRWFDMAYLSANGVLDNSSVNLYGYNYRTTALAAGSSYTVTLTFPTTNTTVAGNYTLFIKADGHSAAQTGGTNTDTGNLVESNETNNAQAVPVTLPGKPDLTVSNSSVGSIVENQDGSYSIPVTFTVSNSGASPAQPRWFDMAYLSTNGVLDNSSVNLYGYNYRTAALATASSYTVTVTFPTTSTTAAGNYTLFIKADGHSAAQTGGTNTDSGNVVESNESNNTRALALTLPGRPDLSVSNMNVGTIVKNANASYNIPVTYTVNNIGNSAAQPRWFDLAYLSTNGVLDNSSVNLSGYNYRLAALAAGSSYSVTTTFTTTTTTAAGSYTLFVKADGHGSQVGGTNTDNGIVAEVNESNNAASQVVVLP
jgi:hypothetical protein